MGVEGAEGEGVEVDGEEVGVVFGVNDGAEGFFLGGASAWLDLSLVFIH